jgi:DNA-binding SARP family transcriptional activator/predicted ATPase
MESVPRLRIMALGPPRVLLGDAVVIFTGRKPLALLVYLAVSGRVHSRDALAALLFDAGTDDKARSQLRSTLTYLRAELGEYLVVTRSTVGLAHDHPVWLDVAELEAAAQDEAPRAEPDRLAQAVSLYHGEFLAAFALRGAPEFDAWLQGERERLRALLVRLLTHLIQHGGEQGDLPSAMSWARRLLQEEPWHEATHRQLMRLLARAGQREAALAQYEACRRTLAEELGAVPEAKTTALYEQLRTGPLAPPANLPAPQADFVGREAELALVAERLADPGCRLLTLLGLGGSGKTSLALHAAVAQARPMALAADHLFADGVYLVDLAGPTVPPTGSADRAHAAAQHLATAIGRVLGLEFRGADPVAHLAAWLCERAVLLVLDNVEHLLDGAALLTSLLERAPRLKLLVTSRERLHLREEWVLEVGGLPLPGGPDEVEQAPASSLYLQHMGKAGASESLSESDRRAVVRICALTQGLPLALVLAAHLTSSLSSIAIARELEAGLDLLTTAPGHLVPGRQRSMRVILQSTWERLRVQERGAMRRLAVLQPGFTLEAARAVAGVDLVTLRMLGEGALIDHDPAAGRYTMHEFIRQYAAVQLAVHAEEETETRARHAAFYAALVRRLAPALRQTIEAQEAISADIANIRASWDWAAERAEAGLLEQLLEGFAEWHELQGLPGSAAEALDRAAERLRTTLAQAARPDPSLQRLLGFVLVEEVRSLNWQAAYSRIRPLLEEARDLALATASPHLEGRVSYGLGALQFRQRDVRGAMHWLRQSLALARAAREPSLEADALVMLGRTAILAGEYAQVKGYLDRALGIWHDQNDHLGEVSVSYSLALLAHARGEFGEAQRLLQDALPLVRSWRWRFGEGFLLHLLGQIHEGWGRHVAAEDLFAQDLRIMQETGDRTRQGFTLAALGRNALYQGDPDRADRLLERALSLSREVSSQESATMALRGLSLLANYQGDDQRASRCAEEALEIAQTAGLRREERLAVRLLGHALLALGELPAAQAAYQQAADLDEALGFQHLRVETATDLARAALAEGNTVRAAAYTAAVLPELEHGALPGLEEPTLAYLTSYQVLRACDDARADGVLAAGYAFLQERAAQFVDEEMRSRFLGNLPPHRELLTAWHAHSALAHR